MKQLQAQDLRIGNLVMRENYLINRYDKFKKHQIVVDHNDITACVIAPHDFEPIPLTEDLLVNMGFVLEHKESFVLLSMSIENRNTDPYINKEIREKLKDGFGIWFRGGFIGDIKHVHQLQNLFHSLTGEELTINN